jgi:branched-chain amino acid transport system ATP-binding protein
MLEIKDLTVTFDTTRAVDQVSLNLAAGEVVGLLGPNGAGKTSTLRAVSGLIPFDGTIHFDGQRIASGNPASIARRGLIHVPEGRRIFPSLSVRENLQIADVARGDRRPDYTIADVFDLFPALPKLDQRAGYTLSGGEQQMVAIGRGLLAAPRLMLLDEPSLGLAPVVAAAVFRALGEIRSRTTLLIVEQNTVLALGACDRAHVMNTGQIVLSGQASELQDRATLLASYLGQKDALAGTRDPETPS